jgi:hypothetical protein
MAKKTLSFLLAGLLAVAGCAKIDNQTTIARDSKGKAEYPYKLLIDINGDGKADLVRSYIVLPAGVGTIIYQDKLR